MMDIFVLVFLIFSILAHVKTFIKEKLDCTCMFEIRRMCLFVLLSFQNIYNMINKSINPVIYVEVYFLYLTINTIDYKTCDST
jgi:hypothetical protein